MFVIVRRAADSSFRFFDSVNCCEDGDYCAWTPRIDVAQTFRTEAQALSFRSQIAKIEKKPETSFFIEKKA